CTPRSIHFAELRLSSSSTVRVILGLACVLACRVASAQEDDLLGGFDKPADQPAEPAPKPAPKPAPAAAPAPAPAATPAPAPSPEPAAEPAAPSTPAPVPA